MTRIRWFFSAVAAIACGSVGFLVAESGKPSLKAGDTAPLFEGVDQNGNTVRLAAFRGKSAVVLYFYPKDGTPGCTAQACSLRDGYRDIQAAGAVVIGVSADTARSHEEFATKHSLPFSILPDPDRTIIGRYGVRMPIVGIARRVTFIVDREGVVEAVITNTRTKDHDRQVLDILHRNSRHA